LRDASTRTRRPPTTGSCLTPIDKRSAVNPFIEHHQQSIRFQYSCFDRMLLNAVVHPCSSRP
jgi:hypothetical protein